MGEYAEAAMWAEMHGLDPADMSPEDWSDFYDDAPQPDDRRSCRSRGDRGSGSPTRAWERLTPPET